jgi:hypothetical protein
MSHEVFAHLRHARALSQSGRCAECARVILMALGKLRDSTSTCKAAQHLTPQQCQHLTDSLFPLLKCEQVASSSFFALYAHLSRSHALETAVDEDEMPGPELLHLHLQALAVYSHHPDVSVLFAPFVQARISLNRCAASVCHFSTSKNGGAF